MSPRWENGAKSVIRLDLEARRAVVFREFQPLALLVGEAVAPLLLLRELALKAPVSLIREGQRATMTVSIRPPEPCTLERSGRTLKNVFRTLPRGSIAVSMVSKLVYADLDSRTACIQASSLGSSG